MSVPLFERTRRVINNKQVWCYIIPVWKWRGMVVRRDYALKLRTKFGYKNAQLTRQIKLLKERHLVRDKEIIVLKAKRQYYKRRVQDKIKEVNLLIEQIKHKL